MRRRHFTGRLANIYRMWAVRRNDLSAGLRSATPTSESRLYFKYGDRGGAVGVITPHTDDILGCGESRVLPLVRRYLEPFWGLEAAGTGVYTRGYGSAPGNEFLLRGHPEEVYGGASTGADPSGAVGIATTPFVGGRGVAAPAQAR